MNDRYESSGVKADNPKSSTTGTAVSTTSSASSSPTDRLKRYISTTASIIRNKLSPTSSKQQHISFNYECYDYEDSRRSNRNKKEGKFVEVKSEIDGVFDHNISDQLLVEVPILDPSPAPVALRIGSKNKRNKNNSSNNNNKRDGYHRFEPDKSNGSTTLSLISSRTVNRLKLDKSQDYHQLDTPDEYIYQQHQQQRPSVVSSFPFFKSAALKSTPSFTMNNPHAPPPNGVGGFSNNNNNNNNNNMNNNNNNNGGAAPGGAVVPESYFTESRKGEVNELRQLLRNFSMEKSPLRRRDIIKKVIAYMTLGIDVSRLFTEMMLVIETRDLVIKKMVYLFLCNYATTNPDLAQMCTNTLTKDCANDDPMVRGLALRSLCSLRLPQMVEYVSEPVRRSLVDSHAYVRKTAVMGILKIYHLDPDKLEECGFVDTLYDMLRDPDASVVANCILVLEELMAKGPDGGMAINRAIMLHLLNRLSEFSEFGVLAVLDLVPRYIPANDEEGFQIMNLLDPVLRTTNAGAFTAVIFAFLSLTQNLPDIDQPENTMRTQIVSRVRAPLITMMTGGSAELTYCLLKHVDALIELCPGIFDDEYRQFYVRHHEPTGVKYLKTTVLSKLVNPTNAPDIVAELAENVRDMDTELARLSVRAMTRIACRDVGGDGCADSIAKRLVDMLDSDIPHVSSEAATALAGLVRKHPELKLVVSPPLPRALKYMVEGRGKASLIYLLGECGDVVPEAPYSLERLIDSYDTIKEAEVKIALLMSTMKLFFLRPPEVQRMLGRLLKKATEDVTSQDLHDRALLYYRLLRTSSLDVDPSIVRDVVSTDCNLAASSNFSEEEIDDDIRDELMKEFNSLSIVYGSTGESFIAEEFQVKFVRMPAEHPLDTGTSSATPPAENLDLNDERGAPPPELTTTTNTTTTTTPTPSPAPAAEMDLLGFGPPDPTSTPAFALDPTVQLSSDEYQTRWGAVSDAHAHVLSVPLGNQPSTTADVETPLASAYIPTMASGDLPDEMKFFLYAREVGGGAVFLAQGSLGKAPGGVGPVEFLLTVKISGGVDPVGRESAVMFVDVVKGALASFG